MDLAEDLTRARSASPSASTCFAHRDQRLDLGLRGRALGLDLQLREQLVEHLLELPFGAIVGEVGDRLAAIDRIDGRDRLDAELRGEQLVLVDVDLGELHALGRHNPRRPSRASATAACTARTGPDQKSRMTSAVIDGWMTVGFEALDRFALGFAKAQSRHWSRSSF